MNVMAGLVPAMTFIRKGRLIRLLSRGARPPQLRLRRAGEAEFEHRALVASDREAEVAAVALGQLAGDGEAEARGIRPARSGEGLEQPLADALGYAGAVVRDPDQ